VDQGEGQLQGKQAQEVPLEQRLQPIGQVAELHGAADGDEVVQGAVTLLVVQSKESGRGRLQPPLEGCLLHGHMGAACNTRPGGGGIR